MLKYTLNFFRGGVKKKLKHFLTEHAILKRKYQNATVKKNSKQKEKHVIDIMFFLLELTRYII